MASDELVTEGFCGYEEVMSFPDQSGSPDEAPSSDGERQADASQDRANSTGAVPRTRTGMAWVGIFIAALLGIALVVFIAQNTQRVEVSFLWMSVQTPLAVALLIAGVGSIMLTLIIGSARILQLRREVRKQGA
jgi:uncharacterized integral membrane protein